MKPHPLEFLRRIVAAVDQQEHTIEEVAALFGVSERYVYQLLKSRRETGDLSPLPQGGGAPLKLDEAKLLELAREATGARVEPLPAYSPDFNPKEGCISKVKAELKRVNANTVRKLRNALRRAYAKVALADIRGWFRHCGYSVP